MNKKLSAIVAIIGIASLVALIALVSAKRDCGFCKNSNPDSDWDCEKSVF
mgnify:CR=1 FL=1